MGCFFACFGSSKDAKCRNQRHRILPRDQRGGTYRPVQVSIVSSNQEKIELPITPASQIKDTPPVEQTSSGKRKKVVTFDSNIKTYEPPVSTPETKHHESDNVENWENEKKELLAKSSKVNSNSEDGSANSSLGSSFPPNYRYQNCRESDDEIEESDCDDEYDLDDDEELDDDEYNDVYNEDDDDDQRRSSEEQLCDSLSSMESRTRDRSGGVLNPVENLSQWKILKTRGTSPFKLQKENSTPELLKNPNQEIAVDASLSNWLISSESAAKSKNNSISYTSFTPEKGSNSPKYLEDRPILGALTIEEINKFSTPSSSPRKSPNRNPDDVPIIGSVGSYWSRDSDKDSGSVSSSYKGIPNTTSKYREDKRVNWHSTPFETRLEKALNRHGCAEA